MATKTIILRPTSVTCDDETLVTLYPTDTLMSNAHILVNETTADDDATYITNGLGSNIHYHFSYTKPDDLKNVSKFSFKVRYKAEGTESGTTYTICFASNNYNIGSSTGGSSTEYTDVSESITTDISDSIIAEFNNVSSTCNFYITQATATGNNKSKPIRTTQIYVEITYEDNNAAISYFKQDGNWVNIGVLTMYYKRNNKWRKLNDADLESYTNTNYITEVLE